MKRKLVTNSYSSFVNKYVASKGMKLREYPGWNIIEGIDALTTGPDGERWKLLIDRVGVPQHCMEDMKKKESCTKLEKSASIDVSASETNSDKNDNGGEWNSNVVVSSASVYGSLVKMIVYQQLSMKSAATICSKFVQALNVSRAEDLTPEVVHAANFSKDGEGKVLVNGTKVGISAKKASYVLSLTEHFMDETKLKGINVHEVDVNELRHKLIAVKGIGDWTIEMFMLFKLGLGDVFSPGDLGIRKGVYELYQQVGTASVADCSGQNSKSSLDMSWKVLTSEVYSDVKKEGNAESGDEELFQKKGKASNWKALISSSNKKDREDLLMVSERWKPYRSLACMYFYGIIDLKKTKAAGDGNGNGDGDGDGDKANKVKGRASRPRTKRK